MKQQHKQNPRIANALDELKSMIRTHYPSAKFEVNRSADEAGDIYLTTIIDIEETDEIVDLVIERLIELQVEERLPIHVIPLRPERAAQLESSAISHPRS